MRDEVPNSTLVPTRNGEVLLLAVQRGPCAAPRVDRTLLAKYIRIWLR